jgi:proline iminopeptidase
VPRESVLDRKVHLEDELVLQLPEVQPLCRSFKGEQRKVDVGDCKLYCEVEGDAAPLVLLHGGPGATHHEFHPHFSRAKDFASVIYYDQRGCGQSDAEPGPDGYSVEQAVHDLEKLRQGLGIHRWVVLGHSYGGLLAQVYATDHPETVRGLVLVGSSLAMSVRTGSPRWPDYLSKEERATIGEVRRHGELSVAQQIFNAFINGDWKRQNFYRPTREEIARQALYGWKPAPGFRNAMGKSVAQVDLKGAFDRCPTPTLIIEGKYDLTWNTDKPEALHKNHPQAELVIVDLAGHSPFADSPARFFGTLREFMDNLHEVPPAQVVAWKKDLQGWQKAKETSPQYVVGSAGGREGNQRIAQSFQAGWLDELDDPGLLLKTGFALYEAKRYDDALRVFRQMEKRSTQLGVRFLCAVALIWQGQMLDLQERRNEAIAVYRNAVEMDVTGQMRHDQYGLAYRPSEYARERIEKPFERIEPHYRQ